MDYKNIYLKWLNNAYAMERDIGNTLKGQVDEFGDFPEIQKSIKEHIEVTDNQAAMVKSCIERNGGNVANIKGGAAAAMGTVNSFLENFTPDKPVSFLIADYAAENMEIAAYRALIQAAKDVGDDESRKVFEEILKQEEEMAKRTEQALPKTVSSYLLGGDNYGES